MIVGLINSLVEFYELEKISSIIDSFQHMVELHTTVLRNGVKKTVKALELVPGDIVYLKCGDIVAADCIIFNSQDLRVDCSSMTGESEPLIRFPLLQGSPANTNPFDSPHVLFASDVIASGEGYAIVAHTGNNAMIGKISSAGVNFKPKTSTLSSEIKRFCKNISILAISTAFLFFFAALLRYRNFNYAVTFGIGIIIAWVPQGLPLTVTLILAMSGRKMTKRNILVKDLHGLETLGSVTFLATDKTGTLTSNRMTVSDIWLNGAMWFTTSTDERPEFKPLKLEISGVSQLLHICVTCSKAKYERKEIEVEKRTIIGDATETGLLKFASTRLNNIDRLPDLYPKVFEIPFSSETKTHITIHRKSHSSGGLTMHVKGAPETVWKMCSAIWIEGRNIPIDDDWNFKFERTFEKMTADGGRVLGFAISQLPGHTYPDNYKFDVQKPNHPKVMRFDLVELYICSLGKVGGPC